MTDAVWELQPELALRWKYFTSILLVYLKVIELLNSKVTGPKKISFFFYTGWSVNLDWRYLLWRFSFLPEQIQRLAHLIFHPFPHRTVSRCCITRSTLRSCPYSILREIIFRSLGFKAGAGGSRAAPSGLRESAGTFPSAVYPESRWGAVADRRVLFWAIALRAVTF